MLDWFSASSDASLPINTWKRLAPVNLISSVKSIIIDYSLDFYRFPMQLTNFYRFYQLLSIELVGIFWAFLRHAFKKKDNKRFFPPNEKHETYNHVGYRKLIHLHINLDDEALVKIHHLYNYLMRK